MPTQAQVKLVASLQKKKFRNDTGLFVAEGIRLVSDLLGSKLLAEHVFYTSECRDISIPKGVAAQEVPSTVMARMSGFVTPSPVVAVFRIPELSCPPTEPISGLCLALDDVQDPGNLGTILRMAQWFGVNQVICSPSTADAFAPKVVQASMGAVGHISIAYTSLIPVLQNARANGLPVYGTFLFGESIYSQKINSQGVIVFGNEGNGISKGVAAEVTHRITIPSYPPGVPTTESLNVAMAAGIILSEVRRGGREF